jgi:chromosome segregation ATPase
MHDADIMHIERIQVEDGFLDGLDLHFKPGLNTLIGARGTGKTSIIELVRFCFGIAGHTAESTRRSREHALSILGDGQVVVTVRDGANAFSLSRAANGTSKQGSSNIRSPIIFSQTEIESVGLQPGGRLGLIDAFDSGRTEDKENSVTAEVISMTSQISDVRHEIEELQVAIAELPSLANQLGELKPAEDILSQISEDASKKTASVNALTTELSTLAVADAALVRFTGYVERLRLALANVTSARAAVESWPPQAGADPLGAERAEVADIQMSLRSQLERLTKIRERSVAVAEALTGRRMPLEAQSRAIRKEIESLQAGAGEISRQGQQLRERIAQVESLKQVTDSKNAALKELTSRRNEFLETLNDLREKRFLVRQAIAAALNKSLGPRIRVTVEKSGQYQSYSALVAEVLKGSGLRYNELAPLVARNMSPRELLEAAENGDFDLIAEATGITKDRALRFVSALRETDLGRVGTVPLEDAVTLSLLDGKDYKSIEELSTGQRCTVVLPIVLRHVDRVVIVDQPEDHIDNAFIAETLIKAVLERDPKGQIIFSTHNANIPVLGAADYVVQMGSDGHRGFPMVHGDLNSPTVVNAISTVMEGGADAFRRRAAFYSGHRDDA